MMNPTTPFNLLDEPWIRVRTLDGSVEERSLLGVLESAHELKSLAGEIPTQDAAVLRLLEAVLLGAVRTPRPRPRPKSVVLWSEWWEAGRLPMDAVGPYCDSFRDRFDLLHPIQPFMQVANLTTESGKTSGLSKLITEVPAGHQYFTTRAASEVESLTFAEAARWLVHCQAFDPAGIKTGALGDNRVKGGKGYSLGYPAWAGNLGVLIAEGATLFETLMLNLPLGVIIADFDLPIWEREPLTAAVQATHEFPTGPADLFTWASRRIRLVVTDQHVTDVQISNGDRLGPQNLFTHEPMTAWQHSANQTKTAGNDVQMPVMHRPERQLWQGLGSLLAADSQVKGVRAGVLEWLHHLIQEGALEPTYPVRLNAVGLEYGTQNSVVVGSVDDRLHAHVAALTDPVLVAAAVDAAARAGDGVLALAKLASNLALASGGDPNAPRQAAFELGYSLLDAPYRRWLADLVDPDTVEASLQRWGVTARRVLAAAGSRLRHDAGPIALVGRQVPKHGSDATQHLDAALAEIWFLASLTKALVPHNPQPAEVNA